MQPLAIVMIVGAGVTWVAAALFLAAARKAARAKDMQRLIASIRFSRVIFIVSLSCMLCAAYLTFGEKKQDAFFFLAVITAALAVRLSRDLIQPQRAIDRMMKNPRALQNEKPDLLK